MDQDKTKRPVLIITGSAPNLAEDIAALPVPLTIPMEWMTVGLDAIDRYRQPIDYLVTYHPGEIPQILKRRQAYGGNTDYRVISHLRQPGVDIIEPFVPPSGSSALCGALAGIRMGFERIILCGCPLEEKKYTVFQNGWKAKQQQLADRVRSMSGWTRELLGFPTIEWIGGQTNGGNHTNP